MRKVAFGFPGGGTQYVGMGSVFYKDFKIVREIFEQANDVLGFDLQNICFNGSLSDLSEMNVAQPAIMTASLANATVLANEFGIKPEVLLGHSLGEYSALLFAEVLSFEDALNLIKVRGRLLQEAGRHGLGTMMAVNKINTTTVKSVCADHQSRGAHVFLSVENSVQQCVVSGYKNELEILAESISEHGGEVTLLNINTPSHCDLMMRWSKEFEIEIAKYKLQKPAIPVISNLTGRLYNDQSDIGEILVDHMVQPVKWRDCMEYLTLNNINYFIDAGPQAVLKNLTRFIDDNLRALSFDLKEDFNFINRHFSKSGIDYQKIVEKCYMIATSSRNNNPHYDPKEFEEWVVNPCTELHDLVISVNTCVYPKEEAALASDLLERVLSYKKTSKEEEKIWMKELAS